TSAGMDAMFRYCTVVWACAGASASSPIIAASASLFMLSSMILPTGGTAPTVVSDLGFREVLPSACQFLCNRYHPGKRYVAQVVRRRLRAVCQSAKPHDCRRRPAFFCGGTGG